MDIEFRDNDNILIFEKDRYLAERGLDIENLEDLFSWLQGSPLTQLEETIREFANNKGKLHLATPLLDLAEAIKCIKVKY